MQSANSLCLWNSTLNRIGLPISGSISFSSSVQMQRLPDHSRSSCDGYWSPCQSDLGRHLQYKQLVRIGFPDLWQSVFGASEEQKVCWFRNLIYTQCSAYERIDRLAGIILNEWFLFYKHWPSEAKHPPPELEQAIFTSHQIWEEEMVTEIDSGTFRVMEPRWVNIHAICIMREDLTTCEYRIGKEPDIYTVTLDPPTMCALQDVAANR
jgi:hypothetical protein